MNIEVVLNIQTRFALFLWIELYCSVVYDLPVGCPGLCCLFQVHPPPNHDRLIQVYAVTLSIVGNFIAVWIITTIPSEFIDIEVFCIGIVWEIFLSTSIKSTSLIIPTLYSVPPP